MKNTCTICYAWPVETVAALIDDNDVRVCKACFEYETGTPRTS